MKIEILGSGCAKCETLFNLTKKAVGEMGVMAQIEKVEDIVTISEYGVVSTPAFVVNGEVKTVGRVLNVEEIKGFLKV